MEELKRRKKNRSKSSLFNPYKNGISSYDLAYLSSKGISKKKINYLTKNYIQDYLAA